MQARDPGTDATPSVCRPVRASGATVRSLSQQGEAVAHLIASLIINHTADRHRRRAAGGPGDRRRRERRCARPSMLTTTGVGEPVPRPRAPILGGKPPRLGGRLRMPQRHACSIFALCAANRQWAALVFRWAADERGRCDRRSGRRGRAGLRLHERVSRHGERDGDDDRHGGAAAQGGRRDRGDPELRRGVHLPEGGRDDRRRDRRRGSDHADRRVRRSDRGDLLEPHDVVVRVAVVVLARTDRRRRRRDAGSRGDGRGAVPGTRLERARPGRRGTDRRRGRSRRAASICSTG